MKYKSLKNLLSSALGFHMIGKLPKSNWHELLYEYMIIMTF